MDLLWIALVLIAIAVVAFVVIQQRRRAGGVITGTKPEGSTDGR
jgi:preprotein translocase subunit SecG